MQQSQRTQEAAIRENAAMALDLQAKEKKRLEMIESARQAQAAAQARARAQASAMAVIAATASPAPITTTLATVEASTSMAMPAPVEVEAHPVNPAGFANATDLPEEEESDDQDFAAGSSDSDDSDSSMPFSDSDDSDLLQHRATATVTADPAVEEIAKATPQVEQISASSTLPASSDSFPPPRVEFASVQQQIAITAPSEATLPQDTSGETTEVTTITTSSNIPQSQSQSQSQGSKKSTQSLDTEDLLELNSEILPDEFCYVCKHGQSKGSTCNIPFESQKALYAHMITQHFDATG